MIHTARGKALNTFSVEFETLKHLNKWAEKW